ncbi:hypothetical protein, partial [Acidiphilium sp. 37-64-53]
MLASVANTPIRPCLSPVAGKSIEARFDGDLLSSDGRLLGLRAIEHPRNRANAPPINVSKTNFFPFSPPTHYGLPMVMISNAPFMPSDPSERFAVIFRALQRSVADNGYRLKIHGPLLV